MPPKVNLPRKPKLLRSNPLRKSLIASGKDPKFTIDDEDILPTHRRKYNFEDPDNDLSEYIKLRLAIARVQALQKYQEIYYNSSA